MAEQLVEVPTIVSFSSLHGLVEQNTLTVQFLMVVLFKVFARDRFLLLHPHTRLVLRMRLLQVFFARFPEKKVRGWVRPRGRN